jgi:hypothetical protein
MSNVLLNKNPIYIKEKCNICKRAYPETILNIEAVIHHGAKNFECLNRKECKKYAKKRGIR